MKKIVFILISALLMSSAFAQKVDKKAERKAKREKEKQEALADYQKALELIKARTFVITAETITFRNGNRFFPDEAINFLKVNGDEAVVQIAPRTALNPGFNGLGGATLEGKMRNIKEHANEKKNHYSMSFNVSGVAGSAQITINLYGSKRADVMVQGMYTSTNFSMQGDVEPVEGTVIYQGTDY